MNWKCPICSSEDNSICDLRCICGHEISENELQNFQFEKNDKNISRQSRVQGSRVSRLSIRDTCNASPFPATIFFIVGIAFSILTFLYANFSHGISHLLRMEFGGNTSISQDPSLILFLVQRIIGGIFLSLLTSIHWFAYVWLSIRIKSDELAGLFGLMILLGDAYIRISSVFFSKSSTGVIAIIFIPFYVGVPLLILYALSGIIWKK